MGAHTSRTFPSYSDAVDGSGVRFVASAVRNAKRGAGAGDTFWLDFLLPESTPMPKRLERRCHVGSLLSLTMHDGTTQAVTVRGYNIEPGQPRYGQIKISAPAGERGFQADSLRRARQGHV